MATTIILIWTFMSPVLAQQVDVSVELRPAAPENASVVQVSSSQVQLTWEASSSPGTSIDFYSVFYKLSTDPSYPLVPQITRFDLLASYSEVISVLPNTGYDFKVFAQSVGGLVSTENCASCEVSHPVCGNGSIDLGEACDSADLGGAVCGDFGFSSGSLSCNSSCQLDLSACTSASSSGGSSTSSGGGGSNALLKYPPQPGVAVSPGLTNDPTFSISYSGAEASYPKQLKEVRLFYKKNDGEWIDSGLTDSGPSGEFEFTVKNPEEAATYAFDLQAKDNFNIFSSVPAGSGDDITVYQLEEPVDNEPPVVDAIFISISSNGQEILVSYENAQDIGFSGLKTVELWYKKGEEGIWTNTQLTSAKPSDVFNFDPSSLSGTYYFALVLQDNAGNRSAEPSRDGQGNVVFEVKSFSALVTGPGVPITRSDFIEIFMGGQDIVAYKYKMNDGPYSNEVPVDENLFLINLQEGSYTVSVIGKNSQGLWQDVSSPSTYSWRVDFSQPQVTISGPDPSQTITAETEPKQVSYTLIYTESDSVSLDLSDITLFKTGRANAFLSLSQIDPFTYLVSLDQISGIGTLRFSIEPNTASHSNGNVAPGVETSRITLVNVDPILLQEPEAPVEEVQPPHQEPVEAPVEEVQPEVEVEPEDPREEEPKEDFIPPEPKITYASEQLVEKAKEALILEGALETVPIKLQLPKDLKACEKESSLDEDGDGLTSRNECYLFTRPDLPDSDADGCSDGEEVNVMMSDPLDDSDCPEGLHTSIITPQAGWVIPRLHVKGLVPNQTSLIDLFAFPVVNETRLNVEPLKLGKSNRFKFSGQEENYFFEYTPQVSLVDGQTYDLVVIVTLREGGLVSSQPIRFTLDSKLTIDPPELLRIGSVNLNRQTDLKNIEVKAFRNGVVQVNGVAEFGQQIIALWEPLMVSSSVLVDSPSGEFMIHAPEPLRVKGDHKLTLYALENNGEQEIRSDQVQLSFYLKKNRLNSLTIIIVTIFSLILLVSGVYLYQKRR